MRILIADDDATSRLLLRRHLTQEGHEVIEASDGNTAWGALTGPNPPRAALLDWMMPGKSGLEICGEMRARKDLPYVHIILVTARQEREDVLQGLAAGADDYLTKPIDFQELHFRIAIVKRLIEMQERLQEANRHLEEMLLTDHLTKVLNRRAIIQGLERELDRARRNKTPLMIIMADIDHFKAVNDTHGHLVGDEVLRQFSARLKQICRPYDQLGRYGGEEFLLVIPGINEGHARELAERFRAVISESPVHSGDITLNLTSSFGAYWVATPDARVVDEFIGKADDLLYLAKHHGRNRVEFAA